MRWGTRGIALLLMLLFTSAAHAQVTPEYFTFPTGFKPVGYGVTADASGSIWFGAEAPKEANPQPVASLARLVPSQATPGTSNGLTFYPTPNPPSPNCCATQVRSVAYSAKEDRVYYVRNDGVVGYASPPNVAPTTTNGFTFAHLPGGPSLGDIAAVPDGGAWFTEYSSSNVAPYYGGRVAFWDGSAVVEGPNIAIQNGNTELSSLRYDAQPNGIAVDALGKPWFAESNPGYPGYRIATYSGSGDNYQEYFPEECPPTGPCSGTYTGTGLRDVTVAKDGTVWFTNELRKSFGRFDPATLQVTQFTFASIDPAITNGRPFSITTAPDGTIWMALYESFFASTTGNAIVKIIPSATPTAEVFKLPGERPPLALGADNAGNIWFSVANPSPPFMAGRLAGVVATGPPAAGGATPPPTPGPAAVPLKPASVGIAKITPPQVGNGAINTNQICVGPPQDKCSLIYLIREHEYVTGFPNSRSSAAAKKKKPKPRVLGTKTVTLSGGQSAKVSVKLNALGKRILKKNKKLRVDFVVTQKLAGGKTKTLSKKTLTFKRR